MRQVHLVNLAGPGKLPGPAPGVGDGLILLALNQPGGGLGKVRQHRGQGDLQLSQVHHRQGGGLPPALLRADVHKAVHNIPPNLNGGHGGVLPQGGEPVGVVPAHPRLGLLRGNEVVGVGCHGHGGLRRGHKAGVKADKIKLHPAVLQRPVQPGQVHGAAGGKFFVIPVAAHRAPAVVPQNQLIPAGRIVLGAPPDVVRQGVRVGHGHAAQVLLQAHQLPALHLPDLVGGTAHRRVLPALAPPGIHQQVDILSEFSGQHLLQVIGAHAAAGLQVGAAHIHHNGNGVLSLPQQPGVLFPRPGGH